MFGSFLIVYIMEVYGSWWASWTSNPMSGVCNSRGRFDSYTFPPIVIQPGAKGGGAIDRQGNQKTYPYVFKGRVSSQIGSGGPGASFVPIG